MAHAWDTSRGDADVTILNGQVNAKLFFEDSKECKSRRRVRSKVRTWWFGRRFITDFGNGETFRGLATFRRKIHFLVNSNHRRAGLKAAKGPTVVPPGS
jgi:hypothetical protein